jgi:hypothetical protein
MEDREKWKSAAGKAEWLAACKAGIAKWDALGEINEIPPRKDMDSDSCKLCDTAWEWQKYSMCEHCPVYGLTGRTACEAIHWDEANSARIKGNLPRFLRAAKKVAQGLREVHQFIKEQM